MVPELEDILYCCWENFRFAAKPGLLIKLAFITEQSLHLLGSWHFLFSFGVTARICLGISRSSDDWCAEHCLWITTSLPAPIEFRDHTTYMFGYVYPVECRGWIYSNFLKLNLVCACICYRAEAVAYLTDLLNSAVSLLRFSPRQLVMRQLGHQKPCSDFPMRWRW